MQIFYTAEALSSGTGRAGRAGTSDGSVVLELGIPTEMGGPGGGTNPEQLFALGYSACFHSALKAVAREQKVTVTDSSVGARVHIGTDEQQGYRLAVELEVTIPGLDPQQAQELAEAAHRTCPYSNATRGNIDVSITVGDD